MTLGYCREDGGSHTGRLLVISDAPASLVDATEVLDVEDGIRSVLVVSIPIIMGTATAPTS
jgi:hypothetical protein